MSTAQYYLDYTWNGENWFQMSNWPAKNADPKTRMQFSSRDEALERAKPWCGYGPAQFRIERVEGGVSTFEVVGGWTRVEDGLPSRSTEPDRDDMSDDVLCWNERTKGMYVAYYDFEYQRFRSGESWRTPTHWCIVHPPA